MIKKLICLVVAVGMLASVFTACGSNSDTSTSTSSATGTAAVSSGDTTSGSENLTPYSLSALLPGDTPLQLDEVLAETNVRHYLCILERFSEQNTGYDCGRRSNRPYI